MKEPCAEMQPMLCKDSARRAKRKTNSFDFASKPRLHYNGNNKKGCATAGATFYLDYKSQINKPVFR